MPGDALFSYVKLLCPFDGANNSTTFTDIKGNTLAGGGYAEKISTTQSKWGGSSLSFIGSGGVVKAPNANSAFGVTNSTDFCIDFWVFLPSYYNSEGRVVGYGTDNASANWAVNITSARKVKFAGGDSISGNTILNFTSQTIPLSQWSHVRVTRSGTAVSCYVDGASAGSGTFSSAIPFASNRVWIGGAHSSSGVPTLPLDAYLDDLRVTIGHSRSSENGAVPTAAYPTTAVTAAYALVGNIQTTVTPYSYYVSPVNYALIGNIQTAVTPQSTIKAHKKYKALGMIITKVIPSAVFSRPINIPVTWVSKQYLCKLTGAPDLVLPVSSISASLTVSGGSSINLTINNGSSLIDAIIARDTGNIIISRLYVYSDGSQLERPFISVKYDDLSSYAGANAGTTITLAGRKTIKATSSKVVVLNDATYRSLAGGARHYRCAINDELSLGDTAIINGEQLIVGKISYYIAADQEMMEFTEYLPDGEDLPGGIGRNSRPPALSAYSVLFTNVNYNLWLTNAFYYSGIVNNTLTNGLPYIIYSDSAGLLWYINGFEGQANFPVLLSDNVTQASINV